MKQGGGTIDTNALATGRGLSSGSPSVAPVWSSPTSVKTSVGTTGSYIPSYTSWYPTTHQESMQQSQLMWTETSALDSAVARESGWWRGIQPLIDAQCTNPGVCCCIPRADTVASSYRMTASSEDEEQGEEGTERLKRHAVPPRATSPWQWAEAVDKWILFWLLFIIFYFKKSYSCGLFCLWAIGYIFLKRICLR